MDWREGEIRELALDAFDQRFARYRLQVDQTTRQAMIASLGRFGQLSPVVVCELGGQMVLIDGFKRHDAARQTKGFDGLSARRIAVDEASAKAAMYGLNCLVRRMHELEEAWIVYQPLLFDESTDDEQTNDAPNDQAHDEEKDAREEDDASGAA